MRQLQVVLRKLYSLKQHFPKLLIIIGVVYALLQENITNFSNLVVLIVVELIYLELTKP